MASIITLTGPAHCGKSTIRNMIIELKSNSFKPVLFKKYTTRAPRKNDDDVICVDRIPSECDLVYEQYGVRYGLRMDDFYSHLERGETPIVVLNDVRAVEDVRNALGPQVYSLFLYRKPANYEDFLLEEKQRATNDVDLIDVEKTARTRFEKANAIYRIYIENIYLFDNVILNVTSIDITNIQVKNIVSQLSKKAEGLK